MTENQQFQVHTSFSELVDAYDGFILDQFGVLHNGTHGLEGAPELVAELVEKGKKLIILSNSSSSAEATKAKLPKLGFDPNHFVGAVTSGEEAGRHIAKTFGGKKAVFLTWKTPNTPSPMQFIELCGDDVQVTDKPDEAEFVILHGVDVLRGPGLDGEASETSLGSYYTDASFSVIDPILKQCLQRKLPMICANPDFIMVKPDGTTGHMPGKIAQRYEEMGGSCVSFGKPHVPHFEACLRDLGLPKDRVAHVGDSLHHDIAGANSTGIASVFVTGGVHREELGADLGALPEKRELESLFTKHSQTPTHVVPMFRL
jgi:HAD superfamily hydrolase (TIGR01450 family)